MFSASASYSASISFDTRKRASGARTRSSAHSGAGALERARVRTAGPTTRARARTRGAALRVPRTTRNRISHSSIFLGFFSFYTSYVDVTYSIMHEWEGPGTGGSGGERERERVGEVAGGVKSGEFPRRGMIRGVPYDLRGWRVTGHVRPASIGQQARHGNSRHGNAGTWKGGDGAVMRPE